MVSRQRVSLSVAVSAGQPAEGDGSDRGASASGSDRKAYGNADMQNDASDDDEWRQHHDNLCNVAQLPSRNRNAGHAHAQQGLRFRDKKTQPNRLHV